jgi:hypothetical protein
MPLVSSAFGEMDQKKAEGLVKEYFQTLSHPKPVAMPAVEDSSIAENLDALLYKTHVLENADKSTFMSDEYFKTPSISTNKVPKGEYFVNDYVFETTEQIIPGSSIQNNAQNRSVISSGIPSDGGVNYNPLYMSHTSANKL